MRVLGRLDFIAESFQNKNRLSLIAAGLVASMQGETPAVRHTSFKRIT